MLTPSNPLISQFIQKNTFQDEPHEDGFGERALWAAVITQALMDGASNSMKPEARKAKAEAIEWLQGTEESFKEVCEMAGYCPNYVREMAQQALTRQCRWRNARSPQQYNTRHISPAAMKARISGEKRRHKQLAEGTSYQTNTTISQR